MPPVRLFSTVQVASYWGVVVGFDDIVSEFAPQGDVDFPPNRTRPSHSSHSLPRRFASEPSSLRAHTTDFVTVCAATDPIQEV